MADEIALARELGIDVATLDALRDYTNSHAAELFGGEGATMDEDAENIGDGVGNIDDAVSGDDHIADPRRPARDVIVSVTYGFAGANGERMYQEVDFPTEQGVIDALLEKAGLSGVDGAYVMREPGFCVTNYHNNFDGFEYALDAIVAGARPDELNALAERIQRLDRRGREDLSDALTETTATLGVDHLRLLAERCGNPATMKVFIDNGARLGNGGAAVPLPATRAFLQPFLDVLDITDPADAAIENARSRFVDLGRAACMRDCRKLNLAELNYLAAKMQGLSETERALFGAAISTGWHNNSVADMINIIENLGDFELRDGDAKQFGERMLASDAKGHAAVLDALRESGDESQSAFADYVERLQESADAETYGHIVARDDEGACTKHGYLSEAKFQRVYRGVQDLPDEYRAMFADVAATEHAQGGNPPEGAAEHDIDADILTMPPLTVYIENAAHPEFGGATLPLPITADGLRPWLEDLEINPQSGRGIVVKTIQSPFEGLEQSLPGAGAAFEELNYLAACIAKLNGDDRTSFAAAAESGMYGKNVAMLINAALDAIVFCLMPIYNPQEYGEFLADTGMDRFGDTLKLPEQHGGKFGGELAEEVKQLWECADFRRFGDVIAEQDGGYFTGYGYLTMWREVAEVYRSVADMPAENRLFPDDSPPLIKVDGVDLAALMLEIHALGGDHLHDAKRNVQLLARPGEDDFLVMVTPNGIMVAPTREVYRRDTPDSAAWVNAVDGPGVCVFSFAVTGREGGRVTGSLYERKFYDLQDSIWDNGFDFDYMDAEMRDGSRRVMTAAEYYKMGRAGLEQLQSCVKHYDPADEARLSASINDTRQFCAANRQPISAGAFLAKLGAAYMAQADNPQPGMLRLSQDAARAILATGAAPVYRLTPSGTERLMPIDAVKIGLNDQKCREFAVKAEDLGGVEKWAERSAARMLSRFQRDRERGEHQKSGGKEGEAI